MKLRRLFVTQLLAFSSFANAQYFQLDLMKNRQKAKTNSRWTIGDWLSQKQKISLWDQWLAANSSANIFEMQLSSGQADFEVVTDSGTGEVKVKDSSKTYSLDLWIKLIGIRAEYEVQEDVQTTQSAMVNLRLIGSSLQSTHLIVRGGLQQRKNEVTNEEWENIFASVALRLYFLSFIGLNGEYRHFFPADSNDGNELSGSRLKAGGFIEWGAVRIRGEYISEPYEFRGGGSTTTQDRDGFEYGVQITL